MVAQTLEVVPSLVTRMEESQTMVAQTLEVVSGLVTKVEESQTVVAQTLEAVSGLVTRTGVVMDGVYGLFIWRCACYLTQFCLRSQRLEGHHPTNPGCVCLTCVNKNRFIL
jgi:hypothetical protein